MGPPQARRYDERDVRIRPGRGSRPRTKQRPEHADAEVALVTAVDRGRYAILVDPDGPDERVAIAMKARELGRDRVVPGDRVDIVGDTTGDEGSLSRIVRIGERRTVLRRTADDTDPIERIIVANADQLVIVTALADPEPRTRMIDRCVAAAYDARMDALLALTKADLADPAELVG
ncbi:GTPase RsgA, partial [uncultured Cellulomonas sp.]|uniref:GTPase RsgA n=1 Tax=uncultured Cellulomonas sp. TaxID=189682 RepID=UPI0028E5C557